MASERQTDVREVDDVVRSVVLDVLRRRAAGEPLPDEQVIASRPDLAVLLRPSWPSFSRFARPRMASR